MCFITSDNLFSGLFQRQQELLKTLQHRAVKPVSQPSFLALRELLKKSMLFIEEFFKFTLLFTTCPAILDTCSLAALGAIK